MMWEKRTLNTCIQTLSGLRGYSSRPQTFPIEPAQRRVRRWVGLLCPSLPLPLSNVKLPPPGASGASRCVLDLRLPQVREAPGV